FEKEVKFLLSSAIMLIIFSTLHVNDRRIELDVPSAREKMMNNREETDCINCEKKDSIDSELILLLDDHSFLTLLTEETREKKIYLHLRESAQSLKRQMRYQMHRSSRATKSADSFIDSSNRQSIEMKRASEIADRRSRC